MGLFFKQEIPALEGETQNLAFENQSLLMYIMLSCKRMIM